MRFIPTYCVREGQILGKRLYNNQGGLLLKAGSEIKEAYIEKIRDLGFQGLYIDDEISRDLEIENVINDDLKIKSVQKVKNMFIDLKKEKNMELHLSGSIDLAKDIVDELIANKDLMVNMIDIKSLDDYTYINLADGKKNSKLTVVDVIIDMV